MSLSLMTNQSYVQARGLVLFGTSFQPYSFTLFIKPTVITVGTLLHVSPLPNGQDWCLPMLGFTRAGAISAQTLNSFGSVIVDGPAVAANTWTYVTVTHASTNGLRLCIGGNRCDFSPSTSSYIAPGAPVTATLAFSLKGTNVCSAGNIVMNR